MKSIVTSIAGICLSAAIALAQGTTHPRHYTVTDLGTLRGANGAFDFATWIASNGLAAGFVSLAGGSHAVLWDHGRITDFGTLGGPNGNAWGVNPSGRAAGYAETDKLDPNGEDFCGFGTHLVCLGLVWQGGAMTTLPTLGGNNGEGLRINGLGEVAGYAENRTPDPNCPAPQVFQFKPAIWGPDGNIHELPTFPGDREGFALGINDKGQAAGGSGSCGALGGDGVYLLEKHALFWENGSVTDLGNLGGTGGTGFLGTTGWGVNNQGEVVGLRALWGSHSDLPGDTTTHAFLWIKRTGMRDLGTLPGDTLSYALDINDAGEIVGNSFASATDVFTVRQHAVIWENGVPINLNTLVVPAGNAGLSLEWCDSINSRSEIVGFGGTRVGDIHAFLATPVEGAGAEANFVPAEPVVLSVEARQRLLQRPMRIGRFGARP